MSNELIIPEGGSVALADYGEYANVGYENTSMDDFKTPFLKPLQPLSPAVVSQQARPGQILNTGTGQAFDEVGFIAATTQQTYIKWKLVNGKRVNNGGFMGAFSPEDPAVLDALRKDGKFKKHITPDGNQLVQTFSVYGIGVDLTTQDVFPAVLAFSSTGINHYQVWRALADLQKYSTRSGERRSHPFPAFVYKLDTVMEKNDQGTFWNLHATFGRKDDAGKYTAEASYLGPTHPWFKRACEIAKQVAAGELKVDHDAGGGGDATDVAGGGRSAGAGMPVDREIPF